jgi:hypothetical protein
VQTTNPVLAVKYTINNMAARILFMHYKNTMLALILKDDSNQLQKILY